MNTQESSKTKDKDNTGRSQASVSNRRGISLGKIKLPRAPTLVNQRQEHEKVSLQSTASPRLSAVLQSLSLSEYLEPLVAYGIRSWASMLDIQEDDLEALKFKLGHRRKLQREIAVSKNIIRLQERLDIDDHPWTEQLAVVERSPLPIRGEKRRKRGHENTGGTSKRQSTSSSCLIHDRSAPPCERRPTVREDSKGLEAAPQKSLSEVEDKSCMLSPAAINSIEFPSSSENILDMDAMALDDLLDWNPIVSIFDTDWVGCESSSLSLSSSDNGHVENMRNACDHPAVNPFSPLVDMHMQYLSQPVLPHDHSRTGDLQALNRNSFNLSQSQASSIDHTSVMRALSYWSSTQDSTSPSRSYSIPSASSEPGNRTRSECTAYTEEEAEINPINKTLRYAVSLNAPTAIAKFPGDDSTTYLNRGQTYSIRIVDTARLTPHASYRTSIGLSFQDNQHRQDKKACWQTWSDVRGSQLSENQNDTFQAVEFVDPARIGFKSSASFRFPKFELVESSLDGFAVIWCPAPDAAQEFVVALRFNFVSTDFTFLKGANNIAVRLCVKTEVLEFFPLYSAPSMGAEICYGKLQLLREHGAARKQTDDLARTMKKVEDMKRKIATINSQAETSSEVLTVREHRRCEAKSAGLYSNRRAFGDMQESKLQSLLACSQSSRSITYLDLRGEPLDDPDARPFPFSNNGIYGRLHQSWQTSSSRHDLPRASATTVRDAHSRSSSKERSLSDRVTEPVACVYILPKIGEYDCPNNLHLAIYLQTRTLDSFIQDVAKKCNMVAEQILRTTRVNEQGVEMVFNNAMICEMTHEQAMVAQFKDIGLSPNLHPSFADVAGFGTLKSRFFELKLIY